MFLQVRDRQDACPTHDGSRGRPSYALKAGIQIRDRQDACPTHDTRERFDAAKGRRIYGSEQGVYVSIEQLSGGH